MSAMGALLAVQLLTPTPDTVSRALDRVEPAPALRARFEATVASGRAYRTFVFDPYSQVASKFTITASAGDDEELDAIVQAWRAEEQADARLFADDLRDSLGEARAKPNAAGWAVEFRHRISPNDGPVDALVSSKMVGELALDPRSGNLTEVHYRIVKPIQLEDGTKLYDYSQTYQFGYSPRWDVSYVSGYEMQARGGRWGFSDTRMFRVTLRNVSFRMAGDARQELASR